MKQAWVENGMVRDVCHGNPAECYHPAVAALYSTQVPDNAEHGDGWVDGKLVKPTPVIPAPTPAPEPEPKKVSPVEFKLLFTSAERVAIRAARATDAVIDDFMGIVDDPRLTVVDMGLQSTKDALDYLEAQSLITAQRKVEILSGEVV